MVLSKVSNFVPRVNQLDAIHLNKSITHLLRHSFLDNIQAISPVWFIRLKPELDFLIRSVIWLGSVGKQRSTFGQQLFILAYDPEKLTFPRLVLHFILTVLPTYIRGHMEYRTSHRNWLETLIKWVEDIALILNILNFFRFLKTGRRPSLIDFCLGLDNIALRSDNRRDIGYNHLTRELVWGGFMELIGLVLPIINFRKIHRILRTSVFKTNAQGTMRQKKPKLTQNSSCALCGERPILPHHIGCDHIYCYFCLEANVLTDSKFRCTICGKERDGIWPLEYIY